MSNLARLSDLPGPAKAQIVRSDPLPRWEQLPPKYQHELVRLLASLLVKWLPHQGLQEGSGTDE